MQKGWRFYLGIGLLVANFAGYGLAALAPFMGFSGASTAALVGAIILLAEIAFIAGVVLLGRPCLELLKAKFKAWFASTKTAATSCPISRRRHYTGISMLIASCLPYFVAEFMLILGHTSASHIRIIIGMLLSSDILFVTSLFILGSKFWERLNKLFVWPGADQRP